MTEADAVAYMAAAVLAVLPPPADRAAVEASAPVKQRADLTEAEWAEQERARFERLYTRESTRADTAARDAEIYRERLERLGEGYTRERKRAERAEAEAERLRTYRDATCICQHTEQQHFEDACLVCDCGDYLPPAAAREVITRYQQAAKREPADRASVLREAIDVAREEGHRLEAEQGVESARGARSVAYLLRKLLVKADMPVDWAVVAYRSPGTRTLYCVICARQETGWQPLTADKVQEGAVCDFCDGRVLAVASRTLGDVVARYAPAAEAQQQPDTETPAAKPVQHAPGIAVLCPDCRTKGHSVCCAAKQRPAAADTGEEADRG